MAITASSFFQAVALLGSGFWLTVTLLRSVKTRNHHPTTVPSTTTTTTECIQSPPFYNGDNHMTSWYYEPPRTEHAFWKVPTTSTTQQQAPNADDASSSLNAFEFLAAPDLYPHELQTPAQIAMERVQEVDFNTNYNVSALMEDMSNVTTKMMNATTVAERPIFYLHDPDRVVQAFQECEMDDTCFVTYHHVPKTGGTTMEAALSRVFGLPKAESSCCNEYLLDMAKARLDHYCIDQKFTSWQMDAPLFFEMLELCWQHYEMRTRKPRRVLVLVTIREPIATTLSFIHQRCNKNFDKRAPLIQAACQSCNYNDMLYRHVVWDRFARKIVAQLQGAWHVMHLMKPTNRHANGVNSKTGTENDNDDDDHDDDDNVRVDNDSRQRYRQLQAEQQEAATTTTSSSTSSSSASSSFTLPLDRVQAVVMEPNDIDAFLKAYHPEMTFPHVNEEMLNICYFRMTKEYIAKLAGAAEWYRRFVAQVA